MIKRKLKELFDCSLDIDILGITDDSRKVKNGFVFVATKGFYIDHFDCVSDAIKNGAACVVVDRDYTASVPVFVVDNINDCYTTLCEKFYKVLPTDFNFIGITGTDGKTTTCSIIWQLLNKLYKIANIGTNGVFIGDKHYPTNNTSPCVAELFDILHKLKNDKCKDISIEVSSEALLHDRFKNFKFDVAVFTNITEDHLNVHKTIENYRQSKFKLLNLVKKDGIVVVNGDDENCQLIDVNNMYTVGMNKRNDFVISNVKENKKNVKFCLSVNNEKYELVSPFLGLYNVYDVSFAFAVCYLMNIDTDYIIEGIEMLKPIMGRREYLDFGQDYDIILDYAHTYSGIKSMIDSVSNYKKIITVTGAAGGREKEKRHKIGKFLLEKSDVVIFTMDDPRYERVDDIIDQMVGDTDIDYLRIIDRKEAIYKAFELADKDSVVLILGKGRDNYMAIEDRKEEYCDYDVICEYFK